MSNPFLTALQELVTGVSADPDPELSEPVDGDQLLHQITGFIARYLQCSEHQRTVLALWVLHTYCFSAAQVAPYLSIQSAQKQSGKTLCLQLLNLLCDAPVFTTGFTASALTRRLNVCVSTLLLDECQATLGTRSRSKAPTLRSILAGGFHRDLGYTVGFHERNLFCPKAFAGMGQLPEALADRSIPIILQPLGGVAQKNTTGPQPPGSPARAVSGFARDGVEVPSAASSSAVNKKIKRLNLFRATEQAKPLRQQLRAWSKQNLPNLKEIEPYDEDQFPPNLSSRRQDLCEPLLQLADVIGGQWPARIREALAGVFEEQVAFDLQPNLQLLSDLYQCFFRYGFPESLSTAVLLDWMHTLPTRPWDIDGPLSARTLARLLVAFEIRPRLQRIKGQAKPVRGYEMEDFLKPWKWHLDLNGPWATQSPAPQPVNSSVAPAPVEELTHSSPAPMEELAARSQQLGAVSLEIASKDKGCNTSTDAHTLSTPVQSGVAQRGESQKTPTGPQPPGPPVRGDSWRTGVEVPPAAPASSAPVEELKHSDPAQMEELVARSSS